MYLIIPLGGIGKRFSEKGYKLPKPLIKVFGKSIIHWVIESLNLENITSVFIPYNSTLAKYNFEDIIRKEFPDINFHFMILNKQTEGAAETILLTLQYVLDKLDMPDKPIICMDGDNFYNFNILKNWKGTNTVFCFKDKCENPVYSYIKIEDNKIIDIVEKDKVSEYACTGAYGFDSAITLRDACEHIVQSNIRQKGEFYTSIVIKHLISSGKHFGFYNIKNSDYICLGTPLQVRLFCNNYPKTSAINGKQTIEPKRFCFDLDGTLVTHPEIYGDYTTVKPIQANIEHLKYLKQCGNTIIIYTARRMRTHNSNVGKIIADIGQITFDTLRKFEIPYDEIYFGKPYADLYIDDLAINSCENLEKETGFYKDIIKPRHFNSIETSIMELYTKRSSPDKPLAGEIHFYNNIPTEVKDMFPLMVNYDNVNFTWYTLENIKGITFSNLYVTEEMTESQIYYVMSSLKRLHSCKINNYEDMNFYSLYCSKMKVRYKTFTKSITYSKLDKTFRDILSKFYGENFTKLSEYESEKKGKISVIHGDSVLTNILLNQYGKIKFIDMRGSINKELTILGDTFYDWAKLYQSIIGYDEIILGKKISQKYRQNIVNKFESYVSELYGEDIMIDIKTITKSLIISMLPLHDKHHQEFIKLLESEFLKS